MNDRKPYDAIRAQAEAKGKRADRIDRKQAEREKREERYQ